MAAPPLTFLEKKRLSGYQGATSNHMIVGATQTSERKQVAMLDRDTHRNISAFGRRTLLTLGRWLYWNVSAVRGAVNDIVDLAVLSYIPQFEGEDKEWGDLAEAWMREHDKICDFRGWNFDMVEYRRNLIRSTIVDGDIFTLQTETAGGYPMIQSIPAHRVFSPSGLEYVQGGRFDGARIIDGIIVGNYGQSIGCRVYGEGGEWSNYVEYDASHIFDTFMVEAPDQLRGISALGASCFNWQDADEARRLELVAQKLGASIGLIETNETGDVDATKALIGSATRGDSTEGTESALTASATERVDGVTVRYFRAGTNSKIESLKNDRPTANQQAFRDDVIREALYGMGWSFDYSYNPTKIGGAPLRIVVERLNRKLEYIRNNLVRRAQVRIDGWRIAKAMKLGILPYNKDWWRWSYQGPAVLTADAKYNSDVDMQERRGGLKPLSRATAERNGYWKDVRAQLQEEARDLLTRAKQLSNEFDIPMESAIKLIEDNSTSSSFTTSVNPAVEPEKPAPANKEEDQ